MWPASGPQDEGDRLGFLSWIYFVALARECRKTAELLTEEASKRHGATPIQARMNEDPSRRKAEERALHTVVEQFPGILTAFWENLDIIEDLDPQGDQLSAFCHEVAGLMGEELGFGDHGERVVKERGGLKLVEDSEG